MPQGALLIRLAPNYCPPVNDGAEPLFTAHAENLVSIGGSRHGDACIDHIHCSDERKVQLYFERVAKSEITLPSGWARRLKASFRAISNGSL